MAVSFGHTTSWRLVPGLAALAVACGGATDPTPAPPEYIVTRRAGDAQTGPAGSELELPLVAEVREPTGGLAKGVAVRFRIVAGRGAALVDTLVATGLDGVGRTRLRLGDRDSVVVAAGVRGQEEQGVTFRALTAPAIVVRAVDPATFAGGDTVLVRGGRFTADSRGIDALFGGARARIVGALGDTALRVVVPPCLASGPIAVAVRTLGVLTSPVAATVSGSGVPLALGVGEAVVVRGAELSCLRLATAGQRFVLVPQFASVGEGSPTPVAFSLDVMASALGFFAPSPFAVAVSGIAPRPIRAAFEAVLRDAEHVLAREAAAELPATLPTLPRPALSRAVAPNPPALGSARDFKILANLSGSTFATVSARLRYSGTNLLIYEDVAAPAPLSADQMQRLGDLFDGTLYRLDVATFGAESDIDGNGRVIVLMTPVVNALTPAGQCSTTGFVPGFFFGLDLTTRSANSNRAEIFYSLVADPRGERSCTHRVDEVLSLVPGTFAHEFQHMISFNQHVLIRRGADEVTWLNEALSHYAEELGARYFDERYPPPTGRSIPGQLLPDSALAFIRGDLEDAVSYLSNPAIHSVTTFNQFGTLEERGAAWLFVRWLGAQKGDAVYGRLVQTGLTSRANIEAVAGESFDALFGDFSIALYADSIPGVPRNAVRSRYRLGPRSLRELLTRGIGRASFPLQVRAAPPLGASTTASMVQGTATFYQFVVPTGGATIRLSGNGASPFAPSAGAQIGVLRITP